MMNKYILILLSSVFIASCSQIILKISSTKEYGSKIKEYLNWRVILGYTMLVISTILTILAFKGLDYKNGPIIESLGYVFVIILSRLILKEKITIKKIIGNTLILFGIMIFYI
ncbi:MAG: EamA family transporter [Clostridia bacterium]|nr:EamA family transporter [Clostridia bacterium]